MLKGHSGAAASSISYVDVYVYPSYDMDVAAAVYITNVKSRFATDLNPISIDLTVQISQYSTVDCDPGSAFSPMGFDPFTLPAGAATFQTYTSDTATPDPSVASLKVSSITVSGNDISSNPGEFVTGSYVYRIFGLNECQGL